MRYANEDFISLLSEVDAQGGDHLDETCTWDEIEFKRPDGTTDIARSSGCEKEMLLDIPYDPSATVLVPEPVLEEDPDRPGYTDKDGNHRPTMRTKMVDHPDDPDRKIPLIEYVEREGEVADGGTAMALPVRVCALEDNVGMFPRFSHVIQDPRSK